MTKQKEREFLENTLFQLLNILRERTHKKYVADFGMYRKRVETACAAEQAYRELDLGEEQREVIEQVLETRSDAQDCELTLTYVAGLLDGILFLRTAGFLDLYMEDYREQESA